MAKAPRTPRSTGGRRSAPAAKPSLPDPKAKGPYRPFTSDPGWGEAWWWLGIPLAVALFVVLSYRIAPAWNHYVTAESGILETAQFILMVMSLALAVQLVFDPFVRRRPVVLALTVLAALACLFIGGEEVSWGQHIFYWQEPDLVTAVNNEGELSLHNMNKGFERAPRTVLEFGVMLGGLLVPALCAYFPRWRQSRMALFLPAAALVPTALFALFFKAAGTLGKYEVSALSVAGRPSEATEFYLYFFIFAYLLIFERRIRELETDEAKSKT